MARMVEISRILFSIVMMPTVCSVGAMFGVKWRLGFADRATQNLCHFGQNMVQLKSQSPAIRLWNELHWHMTITQMIGNPGKEQGAVGNRLDQLFRGRQHLDNDIPALGQQTVPPIEMIATFNANPGFNAGSQFHLQATALAFVVSQSNRVCRFLAGALVEDQHIQNRK